MRSFFMSVENPCSKSSNWADLRSAPILSEFTFFRITQSSSTLLQISYFPINTYPSSAHSLTFTASNHVYLSFFTRSYFANFGRCCAFGFRITLFIMRKQHCHQYHLYMNSHTKYQFCYRRIKTQFPFTKATACHLHTHRKFLSITTFTICESVTNVMIITNQQPYRPT
jgi:hypothetical protein